MSAYLARLKQIEGSKYFEYPPDTLLTKPPKPPFVSFVGAGTGHIEKNNPLQSHWSWMLFYSDREPMEAYFTPEATHAEVLEWFPDAVAAQLFNPTNSCRDFRANTAEQN